MSRFFTLFVVALILSCKGDPSKKASEPVPKTTLKLKYAKGFSLKDYGDYKVLEIKTPWPEATKNYKYLLISEENSSNTNFNSKNYEAIITDSIEKIVTTSTTHIPALELLHVENTLVGFPQTNFISSPKIRNRIEQGYIRELGKNTNINTEALLELNPDLVIGFGIDGNNKTFETIKKSGIPVIYNGDWVEASPLAKAEWIKFFGILYNKEKEADSIFNRIEKNYLKVKALAGKDSIQPTILSGAMHDNVWDLPNGTSTEAQLLKDANTNYLWKDTRGVGSLKLNFESVFARAKNAEIWLNPSNYKDLEALKSGNAHHAVFNAFQNKQVYSFSNTTGKTGGVLYYELGITRPDIVLKDLIKICHPELLKDHELYFFKRLE